MSGIRLLVTADGWSVIDPRYAEGAGPNTIRRRILLYPAWPPSAEKPSATWQWDGNAERPTINPSVVERVGPIPPEVRKPGEGEYRIDHFFVRGGRIEFLGDCTHRWAGQTMDLPEFTDHEIVCYGGEGAKG